jgi:hypothetical protein
MAKRPEPHELVHLMPGVLVRNDVLNIVEKIRAYDDRLDVQFLDPDRFPDWGDAPYRVVERCKDGFTRTVFGVWELNDTVLDRIRMADTARTDVLANLDANNAAVRMNSNRRFREEILGEAHDIMKHAMQNPKTSFTFKNEQSELVTVQDDKGVTKREGG